MNLERIKIISTKNPTNSQKVAVIFLNMSFSLFICSSAGWGLVPNIEEDFFSIFDEELDVSSFCWVAMYDNSRL